MNDVDTMPIASLQKRISAFVLDDMIVAFLLFIIFYDQVMLLISSVPTVVTPDTIALFQQQMQHFNKENLLLILAFKVIYHAFLIWQNNGMTLGKYIVKIKIVDIHHGTNITLINSLTRAILRLVSEMILYIGFMLAFFLPLRQTFHDKLTKSVAINV